MGQSGSAGRDAYVAGRDQHITNIVLAHQRSPLDSKAADTPLRVYLSCTVEDLREHRSQIIVALNRLGVEVVTGEDATAQTARERIEARLAAVRTCDVYVGVFAWRYGEVPDGRTGSVPELEFGAASAAGLPRLVFIPDADAPWPPSAMDRGPRLEQVWALREKLAAECAAESFTSVEDLRSKVTDAVIIQIERRGSVNAVPTASSSGWSAYKRRLIEEYRRLDLDSLTPPEREEYLQIYLRQVFVEPNIREDVPAPELPKELLAKLQGSAELSAADLPSGLDRAELERARQSYLTRAPERVLDVLTRPGPGLTVLLGDPGAGKSTLARYLALALAADEEPDERFAALRGCQPVLIELRDYSSYRDKYPTFSEYLAYRARTDGLGVDGQLFDALLRTGSGLLVILDGLDELFDPREREAVARQIAGLAAAHPGVRVLVTSRVVGYRPRILQEAGFRHYTIQDLDAGQVESFLEAWYSLALHDRPTVATERRTRLTTAIQESPSIKELSGNPLLLTILAIIGKHQELPRERWKVYDHAASVLVQHWDVNKHLVASSIDGPTLREDDKKELLRLLAYRMQSGAGRSERGGNHIGHDELSQEIEGYLRTRFQYPPPQAARIADTMIGQLRERNFVLAKYGPGIYGFVHRALLEFFCAAEIVTRFEKTRDLSEQQLRDEVFGAHWEDQSWTEVLRLVAGMVDESVADGLIDFLVTDAKPCRSSVLDRPALNAVALAVECLAELRNVSGAAQAAHHAMSALIRTLCRAERRWYDERVRRLEDTVLPAVAAVGARWPDREQFLEWFDEYGWRTSVRPTEQFAARFAAALFPDSDALRQRLTEGSKTSPLDGQRKSCLLAISATWPDNPDTLAAAVCAASDPIIVIRCAAVQELSTRWSTTEEAARVFRSAMLDVDASVRNAALKALIAHAPEDEGTLAAIRSACRDLDESVRETALEALAGRWSQEPSSLEALCRAALRDPRWTVRKAAVKFLAATWPGRLETLTAVREATRDLDNDVRVAAIEALAGRWSAAAETRAILIYAAGDPDQDVRAAAVRLLSAKWADDDEARACLGAARRDAAGKVRFLAASLDDQRHLWGTTMPEYVRRALRDPVAEVRKEAVHTVLTSWVDTPDGLNAVLRAAKDPDFRVRSAVLGSSEKWAEQPQSRDVLMAATRDKFGNYRRMAVSAVAAYWGDDSEVQELIERTLGDEDADVRLAAFESLTSLKHDAATRQALLHQASQDPDGGIRLYALKCLLADPSVQESRQPLLDRASRDAHEGVRWQAALAQASARFSGVSALKSLISATRATDAYQRYFALLALTTHHLDSIHTWSALVRASADPDSTVRRMAWDLTAVRFADSADGQRLMRQATRDPDAWIRAVALEAVAIRQPAELAGLGFPERGLGDAFESVRRRAMSLLILSSEESGTDHLAALEYACGDASQIVRVAAQNHALFALDIEEARLLTTRLSRHTRPDVRKSAVSALSVRWREHQRTLAVIRTLSADLDASVRAAALTALAMGWPGSAEASAAVAESAWDGAWQVVDAARTLLEPTRPNLTSADRAAELSRQANPCAAADGLETLLVRWPEHDQTRDAVQRALKAENYTARLFAESSLCLRMPWEESLALLGESLAHPRDLVRFSAVNILIRTSAHTNEARSYLTNATRDAFIATRRSAFNALTALAPQHGATHEIAQWMRRSRGDTIRVLATRFVVEHAESQDQARQSLVMAGHDVAVGVRRFAIEELFARYGHDARVREVYNRAALDPDNSIRALVRSRELVSRCPLAESEELLRQVNDPEWTVRSDALDQLAVRWPDSPATAEALAAAATNDPSAPVRQRALTILGEAWPEHPAFEALAQQGLLDSDHRVRSAACTAFALRRPGSEDTARQMAALLGDPVERVLELVLTQIDALHPGYFRSRQNLLSELISLPSPAFARERALRIATTRLPKRTAEAMALDSACDGYVTIRRLAQRTLAGASVTAPGPIEAVLRACGDPDETTAQSARYELAQHWGGHPDALPTILAAAENTDHRLRIVALQALAEHWNKHPAVPELLHAALDDACPGVRDTAVEALGAWQPPVLTTTDLVAAAYDDHADVRFTARTWLSGLVGEDGYPEGFLLDVLRQPDPEFDRAWALVALAPWMDDDPRVREVLIEEADKAALPSDVCAWVSWFYQTPRNTAPGKALDA